MAMDIHVHALPGLDDGPRTFEEADRLLRMLRTVGVDTVVCTPHYGHPMFDVSKDQIEAAFEQLTDARPGGSEEDAWPTLWKGAEVRVTKRLVDDIRSRKVPTLGNTNYVLVEFPSQAIDHGMLEMMHELLVRDYQPIVAHPERNIAVQKNMSIIKELVDAGLLMQVTAACFADDLANSHSPTIRVANWMAENGYVHFVASDAHNVTSRPPSDARLLKGLTIPSTHDVAAGNVEPDDGLSD